MKRISILAFVALLGACGSDSKPIGEACDEAEAKQCTTSNLNCEVFDSTFFALVDAGGCDGILDDLETCLGGFDDICDETCGTEGRALQDCLETYCDESQDSRCQQLGG